MLRVLGDDAGLVDVMIETRNRIVKGSSENCTSDS